MSLEEERAVASGQPTGAMLPSVNVALISAKPRGESPGAVSRRRSVLDGHSDLLDADREGDSRDSVASDAYA
jgi:hypothetical protein